MDVPGNGKLSDSAGGGRKNPGAFGDGRYERDVEAAVSTGMESLCKPVGSARGADRGNLSGGSWGTAKTGTDGQPGCISGSAYMGDHETDSGSGAEKMSCDGRIEIALGGASKGAIAGDVDIFFYYKREWEKKLFCK